MHAGVREDVASIDGLGRLATEVVGTAVSSGSAEEQELDEAVAALSGMQAARPSHDGPRPSSR